MPNEIPNSTKDTTEDPYLYVPTTRVSAKDLSSGTQSPSNANLDPEDYIKYTGSVNAAFGKEALDDSRARQQDNVEKIRNGINKGIITAVGSIAESTIGLADGLVEATVGNKGVDGLYDNVVGQGIDTVNKWAQENLPTYYTQAQKDMGLESAIPFSGNAVNFWSDKFLNGAGYLAGAYLAGLGLSKMFSVAKLASAEISLAGSIDDIQKAVQAGKSVAITQAAKQLGISAIMAHGESSMEARGIKNEITEKLLSERDKGYNKYTDDEIEELANSGGNTGYGVNLLLTGATDFLLFGKLINGGYKNSKIELNNIIKNSEGLLEAAKPVSKTVDRLGRVLEGAVTEGGQEGAQFTTEKSLVDYYTRRHDKSTNVDDMTESFITGLQDTFGSNEGLESMFLGAIMGSPFGVISSKGERDAREARTQDLVHSLNSFDKLTNNIESTARSLSYLNKSQQNLKDNQLFDYKNNQYQHVKSYVQNVIEKGGYEYLVEKLDSYKNLSEDDFKSTFGYEQNAPLEESKEQIINKSKDTIKKLKESYDDINLRFPNISQPVKDTLFDAITNFDNIDKREAELSQKISKLTSASTIISLANKLNYDQGDFEYNPAEKYEIKGKEVSFEAFRKSKKKEYFEEYQAELAKVILASKNPDKAKEVGVLLNDLNKLADRRHHYINVYNQASNPEGQIKIEDKATTVKEAKKQQAEAEIKAKADEEKLAKTKADIEQSKAKVAAIQVTKAATSPISEETIPENKSTLKFSTNKLGYIVITDTSITPEEITTTEVHDKIDKPTEEVYSGISVGDKKKETQKINDTLNPTNEDGDVISLEGTVVKRKDLIVNAATAIAWLSRPHDGAVKDKSNVGNDLNDELLDKNLLSHHYYQVGSKVTLEVDHSFNVAFPHKGDITAIGVKNASGKVIGYLHDLDWINENNVAGDEEWIALQKELLTELRNKVIKEGKINATIESKSYGKLAISHNNEKRSVAVAFPDPGLQLAIGKKGQLFINNNDVYFNEDEQLINENEFISGRLYAVIPTPVSNKSLAVSLDRNKITNFSDSIINAIQAFLEQDENIINQVYNHSGENLKTAAGLAEYINKFTLVRTFGNEDVRSAKENTKFLNVTPYGIEFASGGSTKRSIADINYLNKHRTELKEHLDNSYVSISLNEFGSNKPFSYSLINNGQVEAVTHANYNDFVKENSSTNLNSYKINENEYAYFDQPVIQLGNIKGIDEPISIPLASPSETETVSTPKPIQKGVKTESGDGEWVLEIPDEEDESLSPSQVEDIQKASEDILIPGFTSDKQNQIVTFLAAQVSAAIDNKEKSVEAVFQKYHDVFSAAAGNKEIDKILNNWNKFKQFTIDKLKRIKGLKVDNDISVEAFEDADSVLDVNNWNDEGSLQVDPKDGLSGRLREILSFIPDAVGVDKGKLIIKKNYIGQPTYLNGDEVMNNISALLADTPANYSTMMGKLASIAISKPWVHGLIIKLTNADSHIQNNFVIFASKHVVNKKLVQHGVSNSGNTYLKVIDTNQNSIAKTIINAWKSNLKTLPIVVDSTEYPGERMISDIARIELTAEFDAMKDAPDLIKLKDWLSKFGVFLSEDTYQDLIKNSNNLFGMSFPQLFKDAAGVFKVMNNRLAANDQVGKEKEDLLSLNNPLGDNKGIRTLAWLEAKHTTNYFANSFKDIEGNTNYAYSNNKFFSSRFRALTQDDNLVDQLLKLNFSSTSAWLKGLQSDKSFKDKFAFFYTDGIKRKDTKKGIKLNNQSEREHEISKLAFFQNSGTHQKFNRIAHFLLPTMSDKTTMLGVTAIAHDTKLDPQGNLDTKSVQAVLDTIQGEYQRILRFQKLKAENKAPYIDGYIVGAGKFILYPELNNHPELWGNGELRGFSPEIQGVLKNYIQDTVNRLVDEKIAKWQDLNIIDGDKLSFIDSTYLYEIVQHRTVNEPQAKIRYAATDFVVNSLIANTNIFQMFIGDPAQFWKTDMDTTLINMGKRLAMMIAPGIDIPNSDSNSYKQVFLQDREGPSARYDYLVKAYGEDYAKAYGKINSTDAQEYTTVAEHIYLLKQLGKITADNYASILSKIRKNKDLDLKELAIVLQPMKPVYVESIIDSDADFAKTVYIKSSSFPLIPQITKGLEIDKLRVAMEGKSGNDISRAAYKSAVKVGGARYVQIFNEDGTIKDNLDLSSAIILPRTGFRIQQELPFDEEKSSITEGSQERKLLFLDLLDVPGMKELKDKFVDLHHEIYKEKYDKLMSDFTTEGEPDVAKIRDILVTEAKSRGYSPNEIQALNTGTINGDNKFVLPLWSSIAANKIESLLTSLVDNKVRKQKMPGFSGILASEEGFIGKSVAGGITWLKGHDSTKPLNVDEIIVPFKFKHTDGTLLNVKDFITDEGYIDTDKLPEELLNLFGYRIPTQGHNSMSSTKIVGFFPYEVGDLVVTSKDFVAQMGSDFDIDKLYIYQYDTDYSNGYLSKKKSKENELIDIHHEVLKHKDVQKKVSEALGVGRLRVLADQYGDKTLPITPLSDEYQKTKYINGTAGKTGTAIFAVNNTFNASIQGTRLTLSKILIRPFINGSKGTELTDPYGYTGRLKSEIISAFLSASVDNEKEQILDKLNANNETFDAIRGFTQIGFDEDVIAAILTQPIVKEYATKLKRLKDSTVEYSPNADLVVLNELRNKYEKQGGITSLDLDYNKNLNISEIGTDPLSQLMVLEKFRLASIIGKEIQNIQSAINSDSKGLGKSLFETAYKEAQIRKLPLNKNILYAGDLIGEYSTDGDIKPTTIAGFASVYATIANNELWANFFPYKSTGVNEVIDEIQKIGGEDRFNSDKYRRVWDNIKSYIYTKKKLGIYDDNIDVERAELETFGTEWRQLKESKKGRNNPFVIRTQVDDNDVTYNAAASENLDELNLYQGFADLFLDETTRPLAEKAVKYFYLNGGIQKAKEFGKYIPTSYLTTKGLGKFLNNQSFDNDITLGNIRGKKTYYEVSEFTTQYFQNNPREVPSVQEGSIQRGTGTNVIIIKPSTNLVTRVVEGLPEDVPREFLSNFDKKTFKTKLYKYIGDFNYVELPTYPNTTTYDANHKTVITTTLVSENKPEGDTPKQLKNPFKADNTLTKYSLIEGETLKKDTYELIAKSANPLHRELAKAILANFGKLKGVTFQRDVKERLGAYNNDKSVLFINPNLHKSDNEIETSILHETIHALTVNIINQYDKDVTKLTPEQQTIVRSLNRLKETVKKEILNDPSESREFDKFLHNKENKLPLGVEAIGSYYGVYNTREFVTMALTSPAFQRKLNDITFDGEKTMWDRFKEIINDLLKSIGFDIKKGSVLEKAINDSIALINSTSIAAPSEIDESLVGSSVKDLLKEMKAKYNKFGKTDPNRYNEIVKELAARNPYFIKNEGVYVGLERSPDGSYRFYLKETSTIDHLDVASENKYTKIINAKKAILDEVNKDIAKSQSDKARLGRLEDRKTRLESEIATLEEESDIHTVVEIANRDLSEVNRILIQDNVSNSDLFYAHKLLTNLENYNSVVLTPSDRDLDDEGNKSANALLIEELIGRISTARASLTDLQLNAALQIVNKSTGKQNTIAELLTVNEISELKSNMLDISRSDNALLHTLSKLMHDASFATSSQATDLFNKIDGLIAKIKKIPLFKSKGWKVFLQDDGNLITPYSKEYFTQRDKQLNLAKHENTKESWNRYNQWKRTNQIIFDVRKLFNDYNIERGGTKFNDAEINEHIAELKEVIGEKRYKELYDRLKEKVQAYKEHYEEAVLRYEIEPDAAIRYALLEEWEIKNSPFKYVESVVSNARYKVGGEYVNPGGYKYTFEAPRKVDTSGNKTEWYDKNYEDIENDENLYEFYRYAIDTFNEMYTWLPKDKVDKLRYNYLPEVKKSVMEQFSENGMKGAMTGWMDQFIESITVGEEHSDKESIPVFMLNNKLGAEHKSQDIGKVLKTFSMMALAYKHKAKVEDDVRLIQYTLRTAIEKQADPTNGKNLQSAATYAVDAGLYGNRKEQEGVTQKKLKTSVDKADLNNEGRAIAGSALGDTTLKYVQILGMGWNLFSSVSNTIFGFVSNLIEATGGQEFTVKQFFKANGIMLNSTLTSASLNYHSNETAKKIRILMEKYNVSAELYENGHDNSLNHNKMTQGISQLNPYELQKRSEYFNQGTTFIALMLNKTIKDKNGNDVNLWDAYDNDGKLKDDFSSEVKNEWEGNFDVLTDNGSIKSFKNKLTQVNKSIHGNYDPDSAVKIKQKILGRALIQFRSWVAEGFANRFEGEKYDLFLDRKRKGRYRTYGELGFVKSISESLNVLRGKSQLNEIDQANLRKNLMEISLYVSLYGVAVLLKKMGDDDDETTANDYFANFLINQASRIQTDITFYTSPLSFEKLTKNAIPAFTLIKNADDFRLAVGRYMIGDDIIQSGINYGDSRLLRETLQMFPGGSTVYRQAAAMKKVND
jgi:hypothetical protein